MAGLKEAYIGGSGENLENVDPKDLYLRYFNIDPDLIEIGGSYTDGLFIYNRSAPWEFISIKPRKYRYEEVTIDDETGKAVEVTTGDAMESHVEISRLTSFKEGVIAAAARISPEYVESNGIDGEHFCVGVEEEYRLHELDGTQSLHEDRELMKGELETDTLAENPYSLLIQLADLRLNVHANMPNNLVVSAGSPITGTPQTSKINTDHPTFGQYISGIEHFLKSKGFGPHTAFLVEAMDQVAKANGFDNYEDMDVKTGERLLWPASSRHMSLGLVHNEELRADVEHAANLSYILTSQLASIVEMISASGPFLWGIAPEMTFEGKKLRVRDMRHIFRKMMATTEYPSFPIRNPIQLAADIQHNVSSTDRIDRALHTNINADGEIIPTEHGMNRGRFTYSPKREGRVEYTGASNSFMKPGVVSASILNYLSSIALIATAKGMEVSDFIEQETGIPANDIWGFGGATEDAITEYMFKGFRSSKFQLLLQKLEIVFTRINISGNSEQRDIALSAFRNMRFVAPNLQELARTGHGTLGETLLKYSNLDGLEVARVVHTFELAEAIFVRSIQEDPVLLKQYLTGEIGFYFDETWALNPLCLEQLKPEIIINNVNKEVVVRPVEILIEA